MWGRSVSSQRIPRWGIVQRKANARIFMLLNLTLAAKLEWIWLPHLRPMLYVYDLQPTPLQEVTENWSTDSMEKQAPVHGGADAKFVGRWRHWENLTLPQLSLCLHPSWVHHIWLWELLSQPCWPWLPAVPPLDQQQLCVCQWAAEGLSHRSLGKDMWTCPQRPVFSFACPDFVWVA